MKAIYTRTIGVYDEKLGDNAINLNSISFKYFGSDSYIFDNLSLKIQKIKVHGDLLSLL